jgi:hypothetical protein
MLSKLIKEREETLKLNEVININHKPGAIVYEMTQEEHKTSMELAYEAGKQAERLRISNTWYKAFTDLEMRYGLIRVAEFRIKTEAITPPQPNPSEDLAV